MKIIDQSHRYLLQNYDYAEGTWQPLVFMKRDGPGYPGNVGNHSGTNCQEVLRALIDRTAYLDGQIGCAENKIAIASLRSALFAFEIRAARRHGRELNVDSATIEIAAACKTCGHIDCGQPHAA